MQLVHEGKSVHEGLIIHENKIVHEKKILLRKKCSWRKKCSKIHIRKKIVHKAKSFKLFPKKSQSQRATAECQPTPKMYILGNKPTPVYPSY